MTHRNHTFEPAVHLLLILSLVAALAFTIPARPVRADTFTVTNTSDSGPGSLRQAVLDATDGDTITFDPSLAGDVITLGSEITISTDLTLDGSGLDPLIGVSGGSSVRVFQVTGGAAVVIDHLAIFDGFATTGGGLNIDNSTVSLSNCKLEYNNADDGAAINNDNGTLAVTNCTLYNNSAADSGGAINNNMGIVTVTGSTIYENRADFGGGGIRNDFGAITITNSTLYLNDALSVGGGLYNNQGSLTLSNSTLSDNYAATGGGLINSASGTLHMTNNILANSSSGGDCQSVAVIATNTNNLVEDGSCFPAFTGDPLLDTLADNGGPTKTMALLGFSPAIENGDNPSCEATDQRGVSRPQGTNCDIGAYESEWQFFVNSENDPGDGTCDLSECTLREAVAAASSGDTISFDPALAGGQVNLGSEISITTDMTIHGGSLNPHIRISGDNSVRVFLIGSGVQVTLEHLDIVNGHALIGGGIDNQGTLTVTNSTLMGNHALVGGGIHNQDTLAVYNSTFSGNSADSAGGALYNRAEGLISTVSNSTFFGNSALAGGGLYNSATMTGTGIATVSGSTFSGNSGASSGGGLVNDGTLHLINTIVADSTAGGDCVNTGSLATNTNNLIEDGTCSPDVTGDPLLGALDDHGGPTQTMRPLPGSPAIDAGDDATCEATDQRGVGRPHGAHCDIGAYETADSLVVNASTDLGDGICDDTECTLREAVQVAANGDTITFAESLAGAYISLGAEIELVKDLTITGLGQGSDILLGGRYSHRVFNIINFATVDLSFLDFVDGAAVSGGGVNNDNGTLALSHCHFDSNQATAGGALNNANGTVTISDCTFTNNYAGEFGGAINNFEGSLTTINTTFAYNSAEVVGGGVFNNIGVVTLTNSTVYSNTAIAAGGGFANYSGTLTVNNATFSANDSPEGGAVVNGTFATLHLANTVLADSPNGGDCVNYGALATNTNNLVEDGTCSPDVTGDPLLGPLAKNGGPTQTMRPLSGSPAIDAGDEASCEATDQRGVGRPHGAQCDIGAYETADSLVVNSSADPGDGICDDTECTLREAVQVAGNGDTITFASTMDGALITLGTEIPLVKDLSILGLASDPHITLSGNFSHRSFNILDWATVYIDSLDFVDGSAESGGGVNNDNGTLTLSNCNFDGNGAAAGGGLNNANGTVTITDCTFTNNEALDYGGAINNFEGSVDATRATFAYNTTGLVGGGVFNTTGVFTLTNSTVYSNVAIVAGGGFANYSGTLSVNNTTFSTNDSPEGGAVVNGTFATLHLANTVLADSLNGGDCVNYGALATNTHNLVEDGTCSPALTGDPLLGALADNGGPTETMALLTGSPAINAGDNATCEPADQRGVARPQGAHCDIGAYELESPYALYLPAITR